MTCDHLHAVLDGSCPDCGRGPTIDRCPTCDRPHATSAQVAHKDGCTCAECLAVCWRAWGTLCQPADWRGRALAAERAALAAMRAGDRLTFRFGSLIRIDQIADDRVYFDATTGAPTQMDVATFLVAVAAEIVERGNATWRRCDDTDTDGGTAP